MKDTAERLKGLIFASASVKTTIKRLDGLLKRKLRKLVTNSANFIKKNLKKNNKRSCLEIRGPHIRFGYSRGNYKEARLSLKEKTKASI